MPRGRAVYPENYYPHRTPTVNGVIAMELTSYVVPLIGGALIGLATVGLMLFNGKIAGVSGILSGLMQRFTADTWWKVLFIMGLAAGGVLLQLIYPAALASTLTRSLPLIALGGFLVGFGTRLGSGCTSGHGVCGVARLSPRSLVATATFTASGALAVLIVSRLFGGAM
ncbi:MAG: YeeE/YedE family protein [Deltaproteobacteria bacterium]|nr:YeeE/YedE family protein [Deltaproteobacteria bacterium]